MEINKQLEFVRKLKNSNMDAPLTVDEILILDEILADLSYYKGSDTWFLSIDRSSKRDILQAILILLQEMYYSVRHLKHGIWINDDPTETRLIVKFANSEYKYNREQAVEIIDSLEEVLR